MEIRQVDTGETLHTLELKTGPIRSVSMAENGKVTAAHGDR